MILNDAQIAQLRGITETALQQMYTNDNELIRRRGMERSLLFRFGLYFHNLIKEVEWLSNMDLDLEYNKNGDNQKRTARRVYGVQPDFILHRRGNNDENILIVEFKGWWNNTDRIIDREKIEDFVNQDQEYRYGLGILVEINRNEFACEHILNYEPVE